MKEDEKYDFYETAKEKLNKRDDKYLSKWEYVMNSIDEIKRMSYL